MKKPVIGIVPTFRFSKEGNDPYQDIAIFVTMYEQMIQDCGGIPIGLLDIDVSMYSSICDGYLWPGGNKIWPEFYPLIEDTITNKKPLLGICLGAEVIATYLNILEDQKKNPELSFQEVYEMHKQENPYLVKLEDASLHSHFVTKDQDSIHAAKHTIHIAGDTLFSQIYQEKSIDVVSLHSTVINRVSKDTIVSARAEDDVVEVVEYTKNGNHILGCMFHPEIVKDKKLFDWLIQTAQKDEH